jgi:hypothetical protein
MKKSRLSEEPGYDKIILNYLLGLILYLGILF